MPRTSSKKPEADPAMRELQEKIAAANAELKALRTAKARMTMSSVLGKMYQRYHYDEYIIPISIEAKNYKCIALRKGSEREMTIQFNFVQVPHSSLMSSRNGYRPSYTDVTAQLSDILLMLSSRFQDVLDIIRIARESNS